MAICFAYINKSWCDVSFTPERSVISSARQAVDTVRMSNMSTSITFGAILDEYGPFENSKYIDGILGMAFPRLGCTPTCVDSFIGQVRSSLSPACYS
eukprot:SAG11_NODE_9899_length_871_cov_1.523316_2_plen_96_part_01